MECTNEYMWEKNNKNENIYVNQTNQIPVYLSHSLQNQDLKQGVCQILLLLLQSSDFLVLHAVRVLCFHHTCHAAKHHWAHHVTGEF